MMNPRPFRFIAVLLLAAGCVMSADAQWTNSPRVHRQIVNGDIIASDSAGGFFVAGSHEEDMVEHLDASGRVLWCHRIAGTKVLDLAADGASGVYVLIQGGSGLSAAYGFQHIDGAGRFAWGHDNVQLLFDRNYRRPTIAADQLGGLWAAASLLESGPVVVRRFGPDGRPVWRNMPDGVNVADMSGWSEMAALMPRPNGDVWVIWLDGRGSYTPTQRGVYVQRLRADGSECYQHNGVAVCSRQSHKGNARLVSGPRGGVFVLWSESVERHGGARVGYVDSAGTGYMLPVSITTARSSGRARVSMS